MSSTAIYEGDSLVHMTGVSLVAGLKYGMVGWKLDWNDGCTQLQLTCVTGTVQFKLSYLLYF